MEQAKETRKREDLSERDSERIGAVREREDRSENERIGVKKRGLEREVGLECERERVGAREIGLDRERERGEREDWSKRE